MSLSLDSDFSPLELLLEPKNWELLEQLQKEKDSAQTAVNLEGLNKALRQAGLPAPVVSAVLTQLDLREHAKSKFGDSAAHMLFTRAGLEQATRMRVAVLRAKRYADAGLKHVVDLGCGIGADSLAYAMLGLQVTAVDRDGEAVACCATNLRAFSDTEVLQGNVEDMGQEELRSLGVDSLFLDPARRTGSGRKQNPQAWSPSWDYIMGLWNWPYAKCVKVAPGIDHKILPSDANAQWVSVNGDLVEASIWSPELSPHGRGREALVLDGAGAHRLSEDLPHDPTATHKSAPTSRVLDYIAEPDGAVIRAGLLEKLCTQLGGALVDSKIAYLTSNHELKSPFVTSYQVLETTAMKPKAVQSCLERLGIGSVEVKKRGADINPAQWQKALNRKEGQPAVVFLTQSTQRHVAIVAKRITS